MKRLFIATLLSVFAIGSAMAQEASCESKAVGKDGKAARGCSQDELHQEVQDGSMRTDSGRIRWQETHGRGEGELHEKMSGGYLSTSVC